MAFSYADPTSGPSAGGIGWFNFGDITMNPGDTLTNLTGVLNNGVNVTFDISLTLASGTPRPFVATTTPVFPGSYFGTVIYTGIPGKVALYSDVAPLPAVSTFTISNIVLTYPDSTPVTNYTLVIADAETTGAAEGLELITNGGVWGKLAGTVPPFLSGLGTQTATITGTNDGIPSSYVLYTQGPSVVVVNVTEGFLGREGFIIGFATTRVRVQKNIGQRIDPSDQFELAINGTPSDIATTSGASVGLQSVVADVSATPLSTYSINEGMAPGSVSTLSDYKQIISVANATPAGSVPPLGTLPISFAPALGDDVTYTILNAAPETFLKTVDKAYANVGDILTYKIVVNNPNDFAISNVAVVDATPAGTTYLGNLVVSAAFTGSDLATGLTITTIPANGSVTISWQVQVNQLPPVSNPVLNYASVTIPNGTSGITNVVSTQVNTAFLTMNKVVDKAFADIGDILTYTLMLQNAGNVSANHITITDAIPAGTTYVNGSLSGATGTFPNLSLPAPIPAGGSALVSFQVKVASIPAGNTIQNSAIAQYTFTIDPAKPDNEQATITSNVTSTLVQSAKLSITKSANKAISFLGDTITYQIAVKNTGNVAADNVVVTDLIVNGTNYVNGTLMVNVPSSGTPATGITIINPIAPSQSVTITFDAKITAMPVPNPIVNVVTMRYTYTMNPMDPDGVIVTITSNPFETIVFRNDYQQQINDLISSVALQEAALAAIANAEGAKIQKVVAMNGATTQELLCINKSVADMMASISLLEAILKQKLSVVDCQIEGGSC